MKKRGFFPRFELMVSMSVLVVFNVFLFASLTLAAPSTTIRFAHMEPPGDLLNTPWHVYGNVLKSIVEGQTGGRIQVQMFPSSQMGDIFSTLEQVARGVLEMSGGADITMMAGFAPTAEILGTPYSFQNLEIARTVVNGRFGKEISDGLAAKSNIRILSYLPNAFRVLTNSKREVHTPADMKGLRIRVPNSPLLLEMLKALGASATPMPWEELYSALQTGVVDGQENPPYAVVFGKLYEVQKFMTLDNHSVNMTIAAISDKFYKGLSPADRGILDYAARQAQFAMLGLIAAKEPRDLDLIGKGGTKIYTPTPAEFAEFQQATREPFRKYLKQKIDEKWIEQFYKAINEAEKQTGLKK